MGGPKKMFECGMCNGSFPKKTQYLEHLIDHDETRVKKTCATCNWPFDDQLALEEHHRATGHGPASYCFCPNPDCPELGRLFPNAQALAIHRQFPLSCSDAMMAKKVGRRVHRHVDEPHDNSSIRLNYESDEDGTVNAVPEHSIRSSKHSIRSSKPASNPISKVSYYWQFCHTCERSFASEATYNNHGMRCSPPRAGPTSTGNNEATAISQPAEGYLADTRPSSLLRDNLGLINTSGIAETHDLTTGQDVTKSQGLVAKPVVEVKEPFVVQMTSSANRRDENQAPLPRPASIQQTSPGPNLAPSEAPLLRARPEANGIRPSTSAGVAQSQPLGTSLKPNASRAASASPAPQRPQESRPQPPARPITSPTSTPSNPSFKCSQCQMTFRSEAALNVHKTDVHGAKRQGVNQQESSRIRDELRQAGLLRSNPDYSTRRTGSHRGRGGGGQGGGLIANRAPPTSTVSSVPVICVGPEDLQQSDDICGQILRLVLQQDILIGEQGFIECGGINWSRIGVAKQGTVAGLLEKLCHLPKNLQLSEYVPPPKTFKDEYRVPYPVAGFTNSPDCKASRPTLAVVSLSCSKILLTNGLQEVVKIAAVDVLTCRVLMNALVCTDPQAAVQNWRSDLTGMTSYRDMEAARADGFKVFKGWKAAKAAMYKFIDNQTIIVGHNLRGDLDALRMVHGRSVDIAKTVEKAAGGPLSKKQLSLETLCRDLPAAHLTVHPKFGRDALQNSFAIREVATWVLKNEDKMSKWAKARANELNMINLNRST